MARYRVGQYRQARAALAQADLLHRAASSRPAFLAWQLPQGLVTLWQAQPLCEVVPANLAFLAMTHHQLGQRELAQAALARLREIAEKPELLMNADARVLVHEAETVLEAAPATKK
jgi:hypothetical protein